MPKSMIEFFPYWQIDIRTYRWTYRRMEYCFQTPNWRGRPRETWWERKYLIESVPSCCTRWISFYYIPRLYKVCIKNCYSTYRFRQGVQSNYVGSTIILSCFWLNLHFFVLFSLYQMYSMYHNVFWLWPEIVY